MSDYTITVKGRAIEATMAEWRAVRQQIGEAEAKDYRAWVDGLRDSGDLWIAKFTPEGTGYSYTAEFDSLDRLLDYFKYDSDRITGYPGGNYRGWTGTLFLEYIIQPDGTKLSRQETDELERASYR